MNKTVWIADQNPKKKKKPQTYREGFIHAEKTS